MATCSASPGGHALVIQTLRLQPHHWLSALHGLPAPAPTCCVPIRDVEPVEEPSQRQGDISSCSCSAGPSQRELSFARFACTLQYPRLLAFVMMAFTSRQHAPEMNCGPAAPSALSYWAALVPRGSHVREFAPYLIHLSIAIPIQLHSRPIAAYHMCEGSARVSLLGSKRVFIVRVSAAYSSTDLDIHPILPNRASPQKALVISRTQWKTRLSSSLNDSLVEPTLG
jgi:hypothetical protein